MRKIIIGLVVALVVIVIAVAVLSLKSSKNSQTLVEVPTPTVAIVTPTGNPYYRPGKNTTIVYVQNWSFNPTRINVVQGDQVVLQFKSMDVRHGVSIAGYGISRTLEPFKLTTVEFTANKSGTFDILCTINCGPEGYKGMKGVLNVN